MDETISFANRLPLRYLSKYRFKRCDLWAIDVFGYGVSLNIINIRELMSIKLMQSCYWIVFIFHLFKTIFLARHFIINFSQWLRHSLSEFHSQSWKNPYNFGIGNNMFGYQMVIKILKHFLKWFHSHRISIFDFDLMRSIFSIWNIFIH